MTALHVAPGVAGLGFAYVLVSVNVIEQHETIVFQRPVELLSLAARREHHRAMAEIAETTPPAPPAHGLTAH